jgi:quercetin dioxygenase-like cupin family protein
MKIYPLTFEENFVQPLLDNGASKVVKFSFPKGKVLKKHQAPSDILVFVLKGKIRFSAGEEVELSAAQMISLSAQIEHSLEALEDSVVVLVLTPSPNAHARLKPD